MAEEDCNEYYRRRAAELTDEILNGLKSTADRDTLFVDLLRTKVRRRTERDARTTQAMCDAVAGTRRELESNNDRAAAAICRAGNQLARCVDTIRQFSSSATDGDEEKRVMVAKNKRLAEVVKQRRERLKQSLNNVRSAEAILNQKQSENDQIIQVASSHCDKDNTS